MLFSKTVFKISLLSSTFLFIPLNQISARNLLGGYTASPDAKKVDQRRSVAGGSRSDCQSTLVKDSVTLLVPEEEVVHNTASSSPTFFFETKLPSDRPWKFTLVAPDEIEPLTESVLLAKQPGVYQINLPSEVQLEPNKTYLWNIAIPCSNDPENYREVLSSAVEYTPTDDELVYRLKQADSTREKASIYASSGIWYDALKMAYLSRKQSQSSQYWQQLLSDISISTTEQ